jgi:hypothetical protein
MPTRKLDTYTLRWLARRAVAEQHAMPMHVDQRAFNEALCWVAAVCRKEARARTKQPRKLTPATTLCGPVPKASKPTKTRKR